MGDCSHHRAQVRKPAMRDYESADLSSAERFARDDMLPPDRLDMDECPKYTLEEAQQELIRRECASHGHDFVVISVFNSDAPAYVRCARCDKAWPVQ